MASESSDAPPASLPAPGSRQPPPPGAEGPRLHRTVVARAADFPAGARKIVSVAGREVGVFNVGGRYYALRNVCPHKAGPLCLGRVRPFARADGLAITFERDGEVLKCPWHQWEFDLLTGQCLVDPALRVRTYPVAHEGEEVVLYLTTDP